MMLTVFLIFNWLLDNIWGWWGITGVIVVACAALAYIFPPLRQTALSIAGVALAAASIYSKGNRDEAAKWNKAIEKDVAKGNQARTDAEHDIDSGRVRGDEWDRDKG